MEQQVILVNERDEEIGLMEKLQAHQRGALHRAFSVFVFDTSGRLLLQQRAANKYHGALLWSNTCCSHPYPGEAIEAAADRRLQEEMGFSAHLKRAFSFTYKALVENGLMENEFDHVFIGEYNGPVKINIEEAAAYGYETIPAIKEAIQKNPSNFTTWFRIVFPRIEAWWKENGQFENGKWRINNGITTTATVNGKQNV